MKRSDIIKKLDDAWRPQVLTPYCEICGDPGTEPHHYVGRTNFNLRWEIRNGYSLCKNCHNNSIGNKSKWLRKEMKKKRPIDIEYCEKNEYPIRNWKDWQLLDKLKYI